VKIKMCTCKWGGLTRPEGPIKIEKTELINSDPAKPADILVAHLSGAVNAKVAVTKEKGKYFFKAPQELGGKVCEVPADSLTDAVNYKVWELGADLAKKKGLKTKEKPRTRGGAH